MSAPITPQILPEELPMASQTSQSSNMTPPPSTQIPSTTRTKSRTPTPTYSHISTPPPTIETSSQAATGRPSSAYAGDMTTEQIETASTDELRAKVADFQAAYQEAKMTAAHHRLQYRMLAQESAAAIERMAVEARMAQYENEVLHLAEQNKAAVTTAHPPTLHDGTIPVQKDLYQRMCREIQHLTESNSYFEAEHRQQEKVIQRQENEIASLSDKVTLLRDRIRENREHQNRFRSASLGRTIDSTPRSVYNTPCRLPPGSAAEARAQPFAALLQASEMASQEAGSHRGKASANPKTGHKRNIHSLSSLPATPSRTRKQPPLFQTPQPRRQQQMQVPATAPVARMSALSRSSPSVYAQYALPVPAPLSDGTVSASEHGDKDNAQDQEDSEAETEILDPEQHEVVGESQASRVASQMLRNSREEVADRSFQGRGMLEQRGGGLRQGKLFGAVKKAGVVRAGEDEPAAKRARTGEGIGLGIAGVRQ